MRNYFIAALIVSVFLLCPCSNEASGNYNHFIGNSFFVKQGSGQCGPTSFYMIFKYYGDHKYKGTFTELPDCTETIPLQEDLDIVTKDSGVSEWLGVTDSGIKTEALLDKIMRLAHADHVQYYTVYGNTDENMQNKKDVFNRINRDFLKEHRPVILHLSRPRVAGFKILSGHYIVLTGYNAGAERVYYVDPNRKEKDSVIQSVPLKDFLENRWYHSPDYSLTWPVPDASWDGTWIGFYHRK